MDILENRFQVRPTSGERISIVGFDRSITLAEFLNLLAWGQLYVDPDGSKTAELRERIKAT